VPSGQVHLSFWKSAWFLPIAVAGAFFIPLKWATFYIALGILLGYGLGYFIDPDLDLLGVTSAEGRMLKIPVLGYLLVPYWSFYGAVFRRHHRSFWTHSYVMSTIIRFAYQFWWLVLFSTLPMWFAWILSGTFFGLCISDGIHIWADNKFGGR
jgi:hypothetical protein